MQMYVLSINLEVYLLSYFDHDFLRCGSFCNHYYILDEDAFYYEGPRRRFA